MATGGEKFSFSQIMENTELIRVTDDKHRYINTKYKKVSAKMYDYNCDIKLKVGKETFKAHKDVLADASDYFSAMFGHNMKEKEQSVVQILELSPEGITAMMEYFYHGHVTIEPNNAEDILESARFFHIEWLVQICCDFLVRYLSLENFPIVLELMDKYYLGDLKSSIFAFVSQNFVMLAKEPKFLQVSYELLYSLLADDHFIDAPEGFILNAVVRWLEHDPSREEHKLTILSLIRYPLVAHDDLYLVPASILENEMIAEMIEEAKTYHSNPTKQCLMSSDYTEVRGTKEVLVLHSCLEDATQIQYKIPGVPDFFSEATDTTFLTSVFEFASVAVLGNFLFAAGGYDRRKWCSSPAFYCYNPRNRGWAQLSSMRQPRVSHVLVAASNGLYAIAGIEHVVLEGMDREVIMNTAEFYNPETNLWEPRAELPYGCFSPSAVVVNDIVYLTGGITDDPEANVPCGTLLVYQPGKEEEWTAKAPMLTERHCHSMVPLHNKIYAFGGYTSGEDTMRFDICRKNEVYDIETDQWSQIAECPAHFEQFQPTATEFEDKIYIVGGKDVMRTLHVYNPKTDELGDGETCGELVQKLVHMKVAFPSDIIENIPEQSAD